MLKQSRSFCKQSRGRDRFKKDAILLGREISRLRQALKSEILGLKFSGARVEPVAAFRLLDRLARKQ